MSVAGSVLRRGLGGRLGLSVRLMSSKAEVELDPEVNAANEEESRRKEQKYRRAKKAFSTVLFGTTLGLAYLARRRRQKELRLNMEGAVRLPPDPNFWGSYREFYRVPGPVPGAPHCVLPAHILKDGTLRAVQNFPVRPDDVFVASFPKSGTTWVQEIVYLLKNELDLAKASEKVLESRFPYLEYPYPGIGSLAGLPSPRLIKTHLPYHLLPPAVGGAKVIYIWRNPKDTAVSYFHFTRLLSFFSYKGTFPEFLDQFTKDALPYCPYFDHVGSYRAREDDPNLLLITYEELSRNTPEVVRRIGRFLDRPLTDEEVDRIVEHTSFGAMSANPAVNYAHWDDLGLRNPGEGAFMRKGKVGDWQNYFSLDMNKSFDRWIQERGPGWPAFEFKVGKSGQSRDGGSGENESGRDE